MSWMDSWQNWVGLGIYLLAMIGAFYLLGHIVYWFQWRAQVRRSARKWQEFERRANTEEERYRTFMNEQEVGHDDETNHRR